MRRRRIVLTSLALVAGACAADATTDTRTSSTLADESAAVTSAAPDRTTTPSTSDPQRFLAWLITDGAAAYRTAMETLRGPCDWPSESFDGSCFGGIHEWMQAGGLEAVLATLPTVEAHWEDLAQAAAANDDGSDFASSAIRAFRLCRNSSAALHASLSEAGALDSIPWANALDPLGDCLRDARTFDQRLRLITTDSG